mgnify:CR=1 FL=1
MGLGLGGFRPRLEKNLGPGLDNSSFVNSLLWYKVLVTARGQGASQEAGPRGFRHYIMTLVFTHDREYYPGHQQVSGVSRILETSGQENIHFILIRIKIDIYSSFTFI